MANLVVSIKVVHQTQFPMMTIVEEPSLIAILEVRMLQSTSIDKAQILDQHSQFLGKMPHKSPWVMEDNAQFKHLHLL